MRVEMAINLGMAKPATREVLSSGTVIIVFNNDRRLSLDFNLTTTNIEGNTYYVGLYDENMAWPEDDCDEEGINAFNRADFTRIKAVEEVFLLGDENSYVEGQAVVHATGTIVNAATGKTLAELTDKEFAETDFGEFYPNRINSSNLAQKIDSFAYGFDFYDYTDMVEDREENIIKGVIEDGSCADETISAAKGLIDKLERMAA